MILPKPRVAALGKVLRDGHEVTARVAPVGVQVVDPSRLWAAARKERRARRAAERLLHVSFLETEAPRSERIYVRRVHVRLPEETGDLSA
jgi:hypothetical protein